jgi:hypothetical protein
MIESYYKILLKPVSYLYFLSNNLQFLKFIYQNYFFGKKYFNRKLQIANKEDNFISKSIPKHICVIINEHLSDKNLQCLILCIVKKISSIGVDNLSIFLSDISCRKSYFYFKLQ